MFLMCVFVYFALLCLSLFLFSAGLHVFSDGSAAQDAPRLLPEPPRDRSQGGLGRSLGGGLGSGLGSGLGAASSLGSPGESGSRASKNIFFECFHSPARPVDAFPFRS